MPKRLTKVEKARVYEIIKHARGILKRKPGGKSFVEEMAEYKREEKELEEAKYQRLFGSY